MTTLDTAGSQPSRRQASTSMALPRHRRPLSPPSRATLEDIDAQVHSRICDMKLTVEQRDLALRSLQRKPEIALHGTQHHHRAQKHSGRLRTDVGNLLSWRPLPHGTGCVCNLAGGGGQREKPQVERPGVNSMGEYDSSDFRIINERTCAAPFPQRFVPTYAQRSSLGVRSKTVSIAIASTIDLTIRKCPRLTLRGAAGRRRCRNVRSLKAVRISLSGNAR